jgi:hypothetical protein
MPPWLTELLKLLADKLAFITPALYAAATFGFFHWLDKKASSAAKNAFIDWLQPVAYDQRAIVRAGLELFDRLYTTPLLSVTAFLRSSAFTTLVFCIFLYEFSDIDSFNEVDASQTVITFGPSFVINILSDYVSLFVVRRWLIAGSDKVRTLLIGPAVGIIVVLLFQFARDVTTILALSSYRDWIFDIRLIGNLLLIHLTLPQWFGTTISALIVHLWLPLLVLCIALLKTMNYFRRAVGWTQWFIKQGRQHPLDAVGYVAAMIAFVITIALQRLF